MAPMKRDRLEEEIADHVTQYKERYYWLAYSYVRNADDALDIVQESIYKAFLSVGSLKDPHSMKTWFYRIVVNASLDFLRKRKRSYPVEDEVLTRLDSGEADRYEDFDLKNALDQLPEKYRIVIVLRFFEDLKIEEIAEVLDENANTIKTRLYTSLNKLRLTLGDNGTEV